MGPQWKEIAEDAFERQSGRCGLCGQGLVFANYDHGHRGAWHAHHINGQPRDDRLLNCVALCRNPDGGCHFEAHDYDWKDGALLKGSEFPYRYD